VVWAAGIFCFSVNFLQFRREVAFLSAVATLFLRGITLWLRKKCTDSAYPTNNYILFILFYLLRGRAARFSKNSRTLTQLLRRVSYIQGPSGFVKSPHRIYRCVAHVVREGKDVPRPFESC
jgi:hypothetical protein